MFGNGNLAKISLVLFGSIFAFYVYENRLESSAYRQGGFNQTATTLNTGHLSNQTIRGPSPQKLKFKIDGDQAVYTTYVFRNVGWEKGMPISVKAYRTSLFKNKKQLVDPLFSKGHYIYGLYWIFIVVLFVPVAVMGVFDLFIQSERDSIRLGPPVSYDSKAMGHLDKITALMKMDETEYPSIADIKLRQLEEETLRLVRKWSGRIRLRRHFKDFRKSRKKVDVAKIRLEALLQFSIYHGGSLGYTKRSVKGRSATLEFLLQDIL